MGIQGLLPLLKSIMVPIHIKELEGYSVAIDTYSWLHKAALSCSVEICKGLPTSRYIDFCMHRVNMLRHHGVKLVLVFDGGFLPLKSEQENKRARLRRENLARAIEHEANGNSSAAYDCYQKAVDILPAHAYELIQVLKQEGVSYVVAPYEADAQMAFLAVTKQVDAVITEDSDLIPFGCTRIIFKMDKFGQGVEFQYSRLHQNKEISFIGFTMQMLLEMCILSGCDYLQSLPGMGLRKAHALIKKYRTFDKVIKHLRYSAFSVPSLYEESFKKAIWTFRHQRVYDPRTENIIHLFDLSDDIGDELDFLGPPLAQDIAKGIAIGNIDPVTKLPFKNGEVGSALVLPKTYLLKNFKPDSERKKLNLPVQKNLLTNYFCFASLEARRKFRAPRVRENRRNVVDAVSPYLERDHTSVTAPTCETNYSPASLLDLGPLSAESVEDESKTRTPVILNIPHHNTVDMKSSESSQELGMANVWRSNYDTIDGKTRKGKRKVVVSSYFQNKSVKGNADNKTEFPLAEDENVTENADNKTDENKSAENSLFDSFKYGFVTKKKTIASNNVLSGTRRDKGKCTRKNAYYLKESECIPKCEKVKFGCNISHLPSYSGIAERSMEKFVSAISSFRYLPSGGSRASGLRAPLKDLNRAVVDPPIQSLDFDRFLYAPKNNDSGGDKSCIP